MSLTHHPVRLFRLSCGCLRAYPMMPPGISHAVLCIRCRVAAVTVTAYPERCCAALGWAVIDGHRTRVGCTNRPCDGTHFDALSGTPFTVTITRLTRTREGKTGTA